MVMSELYSIQDTTLTALGDAVRNKVIGTTELSIVSVENKFINYNRSFPFQLPSFVKKTKLIGSVDYNGIKIQNDGLQGLGFSAGVYGDYDDITIRGAENYIVINEGLPFNPNGYEGVGSDYNFTFEIVIEGNAGAFVATKLNNLPQEFRLTYTAIGLDKNGNEFKYTPLEMVDAINGLMTIPDEALNITGDCRYRFAYNSNNWLINIAGDKITTKDISNASNMFINSDKLISIPFEINLSSNTEIQYLFSSCLSLKYYPQVNLNLTRHISFSQVFYNNLSLREIPEWFIDLLEQDSNIPTNNTTFAPWNSLFNYCYSLRKIPDRAMKAMYNPNPSSSYYTIAYCAPFRDCATLDELINIPCDNYAFTSNQFTRYFFMDLYRAKNITFATNEDSTPLIRNWKSQTLDLTEYVGYHTTGGYAATILGYNSGITEDKQVKDDATYQALKNDPDWFTTDINYSRYNHDSAVNTINSLPDCSASGGTNTIKFKGQVGALTDGGAINTLTEEEIAVATAKGWTVSFV